MSTRTQGHTADDTRVTRRLVVDADPATVFSLLATPREHVALDGSGLITAVLDGPDRLELGSVFRMRMKGYATTNTVVQFERDALIGWRHRGRHVWRWSLRAVPEGTEVTATFDYTDKRGPTVVRLLGFPKRAGAALEKSLATLQARFA